MLVSNAAVCTAMYCWQYLTYIVLRFSAYCLLLARWCAEMDCVLQELSVQANAYATLQ
jgi:hypothetical protein